VSALYALREGDEALPHGQGGPNGTFGVVLVSLGDPEHGKHRVAGELLRGASESLDLGVDQLEELSLELANVLRIQLLAERRRVGEVREENRDDPAFLALVGRLGGAAGIFAEGHAAVRAEGRAGRLLEPAGGTTPQERRAALTAKTGAAGVLGTAEGTDQSHRGESTEATFGAGATQGWLDPARTGRESPSDRQKGGSCDSRSAAA
jgi:hypothetical protein